MGKLEVWIICKLFHKQRSQSWAPSEGKHLHGVGGRTVLLISLCFTGEVCDMLDTSAPVRSLEIAKQNHLLFAGLVTGTVLVFPLNSRQDGACIPLPESQKAVNSMAIKEQGKQLAIAYDDLVLMLDINPADPCPVINRITYTFRSLALWLLEWLSLQIAESHKAWLAGPSPLWLPSGPSVSFGRSQKQICLESSHGEQWALSWSEDSLQCLWDLEFSQQEHEMCYYKVVRPWIVDYCPVSNQLRGFPALKENTQSCV